jgi:hypothetical protein
MHPPLHLTLQNTTIRARIDFHRELHDFDLHIIINGSSSYTTRNFTSLRQMYNYLRAVYGHDSGMVVIEAAFDHVCRCKNIG